MNSLVQGWHICWRLYGMTLDEGHYYNYCCDNLWKIRFMAPEKPGKHWNFFCHTLWLPCKFISWLEHAFLLVCVLINLTLGHDGKQHWQRTTAHVVVPRQPAEVESSLILTAGSKLLCYCVAASRANWRCFLLQYFDAVGWVFWPVKTVGHITYIVLVQTLNHALSI